MPYGTPTFMAPEALRDEEGSYYRMDMWSVGMVLLTKIIVVGQFLIGLDHW